MADILKSLNDYNLHLAQLLSLSRDNPNVMKKVSRLLQNEAKSAGNPKLIDAPCYLHPVSGSSPHNLTLEPPRPLTSYFQTHTGFKKAVDALSMEIASLLGNLHGFFKTSTARREDMVEVREEMADQMEDVFEEVLDEFYLRHVDTRWLSAGPCLQRLVDHFPSTVEFFMSYLPNNPLQNNKKALQSKK